MCARTCIWGHTLDYTNHWNSVNKLIDIRNVHANELHVTCKLELSIIVKVSFKE